MKKILDKSLIDHYLKEVGIARLFSHDIDDLLEFFYFKKNEFVLHEGIPSDYLYFLADGEVRIYSSIGNGKRLDLGHYSLFRVIGEAATLWGNPPSASVQCNTASYFFGISLLRRRSVLLNDVNFLRYICEVLCTQINMQNQNRQALFFPLENRLASLVLQNTESGVLRYNLVTCADLLSTSYRHLLRVIGGMCEKGLLIRGKKGSYQVTDRAGLEQLAAHTYIGQSLSVGSALPPEN
jgi:CRP-like cAMP-binding protein